MTDPIFGERSLYLPTIDTLVIADLHVGKAATTAVDASLDERSDLAKRLQAICTEYRPETVVIAGDLLHAFDGVPTGVPRTIDALQAATGTTPLHVTPGNHDTRLDTVASDIAVDPTYTLADGTIVCHGHVEPPTDSHRYIIGHDHPALEIDGNRHPCFLQGTDQYGDADIIMLPAFSRLPRGTPVAAISGGLDSPFITDLDACRPIVVADTVHRFPPLADLRPHL